MRVLSNVSARLFCKEEAKRFKVSQVAVQERLAVKSTKTYSGLAEVCKTSRETHDSWRTGEMRRGKGAADPETPRELIGRN